MLVIIGERYSCGEQHNKTFFSNLPTYEIYLVFLMFPFGERKKMLSGIFFLSYPIQQKIMIESINSQQIGDFNNFHNFIRVNE
jgi:hypothetical protein